MSSIGKKNKIVAFTGKSNSGKTTLIEKISKRLATDYRVVVVKHDPKDKANFDTPGKDSDKFFKTGADTIVVSPTRTTLFKHAFSTLDEMKKLAGNYDYFFIEGLKTFPVKRIGIFRDEIDESYFGFIDAAAIDESVEREKIPKNIETLDLNNINEIIKWVDKNG